MAKPKNVKLTNQQTCRIVYSITNDPNHYMQCPIMMSREKWDAIKRLVKIKKEQGAGGVDIGDIFGDFFGVR